MYRVRFGAAQNLRVLVRVLGRTVPQTRFKPAFFTDPNCPKLSKTAQNCVKLATDYASDTLILGQISNLLTLSFLMLKKINY